MKENIKPDYGLWAKNNMPTAQVFLFYNLAIKDILRIGYHDYSIFTHYNYDGVEYALSLDFPVTILPQLLNLLKEYFNKDNLNIMMDRLLDPLYELKVIEWDEPIYNIGCSAVLGEVQANNNEEYIPLIVEKFF